MFLSVITKNLNCKILTENLVTFKRWDGVKAEKFWYYGGSLKNLIFRRGVSRKPIYRRGLPKKGAWSVCRFKEGLGKKEGDGIFEGGRGWYPNAHYGSSIIELPCYFDTMEKVMPHFLRLPQKWLPNHSLIQDQ